MKNLKNHYQNVVIGFGKGGKTLAAYLAKTGQDVAVVERSERMYGGTCINIACIPTKSLVTSAEKNVPYPDAIQAKDDLTSFLRQKNYKNLDAYPSLDVITGSAKFISKNDPYRGNLMLGNRLRALPKCKNASLTLIQDSVLMRKIGF